MPYNGIRTIKWTVHNLYKSAIVVIKNLRSNPSISHFLLKEMLGFRNKKKPNQEHLKCAVDWIIEGVKETNNKGVAAFYSLINGWSPGYYETTGYIIPTLFEVSKLKKRQYLSDYAIQLLDWEVKNQRDSGGMPSGLVGDETYNRNPLVFDSGQVLFGLLSGFRETGSLKYLQAAKNVGQFLIGSLDSNGSYSKHMYLDQLHTYDIRVSWALLLLAKETADYAYLEAVERNLSWTLEQQLRNGFFLHNSFQKNQPVITHLLGYTLRGLTECGLILEREEILTAVNLVLERLLEDIEKYGSLAGAYSTDWSGEYNWTCLTGNCQIAIVFHRMAKNYNKINQEIYLGAFRKLLQIVKSSQIIDQKLHGICGGIFGSYPIWGDYMKFSVINWATKFFIDALLLEMHDRGGTWG